MTREPNRPEGADGLHHGFYSIHADILERSNLTQSQFLVWMGQKLNPNVPLYNMIRTFSIEGEVNPEYFQMAFQVLIDHSDALRTVIEEVESIPQQRIMTHFPYTVPFLDFSRELDPEATWQSWLDKRRAYPFKLDQGLFDSALIKTAPSRFIWYLSQHHLITDSWSCFLIYRRVATFYKQLLETQRVEAVEMPTFQDFAAYEHTFRTSPQHKQTEEYWQQKLKSATEPTRFYGPTTAEKTTRTQRILYELDHSRSQKLKTIAMENDVRMITLNLSLLNVFSTLTFSYLNRIGGNYQLTIGSPFHNRPTNSLKETIGLCLEMCPLQVEITKDETFSSLLAKSRLEILEALRYSQHGIRNPVNNRAYDVILNYHNTSFPDFVGLPVQVESVHSGHWESNVSLALQIQDFANSGIFRIYFDFNCDVFSAQQRCRAIEHFLHIVDAFIEDRTQPISHFNLLAEEEKQRVLVEYNQSEAPYPADKTLVDLFEAQGDKTPDATAVVFENQQLTYRELNSQANQLAHHLKKRGVGPGVLVGVFMERCVELVVGLYGILKAGGAYVPLDPEYPAERLGFMLNDTQLPVLLTQERLVAALPEHSAEVVCLDSDWSTIAIESNKNPVGGAAAQDLAYVIYTSGSTGRPKGVCCQHGGVVNLLADCENRQPISVGDACSWWTSLNFDVSVYEIFSPLIKGGTLHIIPEPVRIDSLQCIKWLQQKKINSAYLPPFMLADYEAWLRQSTGIRHLRRLLVGVEPIQEQLLAAINQYIPDLHIINGYGPTEATICCTFYSIDPNRTQVRNTPIGKPTWNTQIYLLDNHLQPVPIGVPGELHVGGVGLARGYLNRPELTAEKFIDSPFSTQPGGRLYKTGDLAYYLPDGNIMFFGRADNQVKIRGFRVELGEIESVLRQHPAVGQVVVILRQMEGSRKQLEAYVVPHRDREAPTVTDLHNTLREKLPDYMVPSIFVILDTLPITPNGKVDRQALLALDQTSDELKVDFVAPRSPIEEMLAEVWSQVLRVEQVGIHDDFFGLGGDSLRAVQMLAQIAQTFQLVLPLRSVFESPTIALLGEHIEDLLITELELMSDDEAELLLAAS